MRNGIKECDFRAALQELGIKPIRRSVFRGQTYGQVQVNRGFRAQFNNAIVLIQGSD